MDTRDIRVVIDSRSRNAAAYPTPSSYEVDLPEDMFVVHEMKLLYANVPFSGYTIPPGPAQRIVVDTIAASLRPGDYGTGEEIAAELTAQLSAAAPPTRKFVATYDAMRDSFSIRSREPFTIDAATFAGTSGTARLLGFGASKGLFRSTLDDDGSGAPHMVSAPYRRVSDPCPYLVLRAIVPSAEAINSPLPAAHRSFAIIPRDASCNNMDDMHPFAMQWRPPLARVSRIRIEFIDPDGIPYDFQSHDHRIDLLFTVSSQRLL